MKSSLAVLSFVVAVAAGTSFAIAAPDANAPKGSVRTVNAGFNDAIPYKATARFGDADVSIPASTYTEVPELTHKIQCKTGVSKCYVFVEAYVHIYTTSRATIGIFVDDVQVDPGPFITGSQPYYQGLNHMGAASVTPGVSHTVKIKIFSDAASTTYRGGVRTSSYYK